MEPVEKCDNCGKEFPESKINSHFGYCRRNIKKCAQCNEMVDINYLEEHNQDFHTNQACKHCRKDFKPQDLAKHQTACTLKPKYCQYCELDIAVKDFPKHVENCGSRTKLCNKCQKHVMLRQYDVHSVTCRGKVVAPPPPPAPVRTTETVPRDVQKKPVISNRDPYPAVPPAQQYRPEAYMYQPEPARLQPAEKKVDTGVVRHNIPPNANRVVNGGVDYPKREEPSQPVRQREIRRESKPEENKYTNQIYSDKNPNSYKDQPKDTKPIYQLKEPNGYQPRDPYDKYNIQNDPRNEKPVNIPSSNRGVVDKPRQQPTATTGITATTGTTATTANQTGANKIRRDQPSYEESRKGAQYQPNRPTRQQAPSPIYEPVREPVREPARQPSYNEYIPEEEDPELQKALAESLQQNRRYQPSKNTNLPADFEVDQMSQSFYRDLSMQNEIQNTLEYSKPQQRRR